jgi:hypothetical protein
MVHRRELDGTVLVLGNQGALWGNAMTWWDHDTGSIWSQPLGEAIAGPRKGARLEPLPVWLGDWASWATAHPDSLALDVPGSSNGRFRLADMAIVLELGDEATAWLVPPLQAQGVVNDVVNGLAVAAVTDPTDPDRWAVFSRVLDDGVIVELAPRDGTLVDTVSGTTFDPVRGAALSGPLVGQSLDLLPGFTAFPEDFFTFWPDGTLWTGE